MKLRDVTGNPEPGRLVALAAIASYSAVNFFLRWLAMILWPRPRPATAGTVCVYRPGNVGDTICALPALSAIRREYPKARLILLTTAGRPGLPGLREVLANVSWIDEIIEYYPREVFSGFGAGAAFLRRIRSYRFDVFIELCNDLARIRTLIRNIFFARLAGVRWAGGWSMNTLRFAVQQQSKYIDFPNEADRLIHDVERCGISARGVSYLLPVTPSQEQRAAAILGITEPSDSRQIIAIAPGAKRPANRWPVERFIEVGRQMAKSGYRIVVLGSDEERNLAERIGIEVGTACVNLAGMTDISGMAAILKKCTLLICNDSGPQHIASAVGTPCVAISSFWQLRGKWRAHNPRSIVLQKMVSCHTCFQYDCPNDNICLTEISAAEAAAAAFIILDDVVSPDSVCSVGRERRSGARDNASSGAILKAPPP